MTTYSARPFIPLQSEPAECGIVAIAAISTILGTPLCAQDLRIRYGISTRGISVSQVIKVLRDAGFTAQAVMIDVSRPDAMQTPVIALWEDKHFVVIGKKTKKYYEVFDPESGWRLVPRSEISECLSGLIIEVQKGCETTFSLRTPLPLRKWLSRFSFGKPISVICALAIAAQTASIALPLISERLINRAITPGANDIPLLVLGSYFMTGALGIFLSSVMARLAARVASLLSRDLTIDVVKRLLGMPLDYLMRNAPATLFGKIQTVQSIQQLILQSATGAAITGSVGVIATIALFWLSPLLASCIVILRLLLICGDYPLRIRIAQLMERRHRALMMQMGHVIETIKACAPLRSAGAMRMSIDRIDQNTSRVAKNQYSISLSEQSRYDIASIFNLLDQLIYLGLGTFLIARNHLSFGTFVAIGMYRNFVISGFSEIQNFLSMILNARVAMGRLEGIVDPAVAPPDYADIEQLDLPEATIRFTDVSFRYSAFDCTVFSGLNIEIGSGECVAIVGPSGSGKSTIAKLMTGALKPSAGNIYYGDHLLDKDTEDRLLSHVGTVMQSDHLISDSVKENIRLYREISDADVERAAKLACIHDFIQSLPMKYLTPISDEYSVISGGQRQRILLARAIAANPKILIMDEATSALDPEVEERISKNIQSMTITRVIFAHRIETIRVADRIIDIRQHGVTLSKDPILHA